jgi:cytochrome c5
MTEPKNSSKSIMYATIAAAVLIVVVVVPFTIKGDMTASGNNDDVESRIQPVALFELKVASAETSSAPKDPETIFNTVCAACHTTGTLGAPNVSNKADWAPRLAQGKDVLYQSALNGKNQMPARGGTSLSDDEIKATVDLIISKVK